MKNRKVIPFPKQKEVPLTYKGGVLQVSAILKEVSERYFSAHDSLKEEDPSEEDDA